MKFKFEMIFSRKKCSLMIRLGILEQFLLEYRILFYLILKTIEWVLWSVFLIWTWPCFMFKFIIRNNIVQGFKLPFDRYWKLLISSWISQVKSIFQWIFDKFRSKNDHIPKNRRTKGQKFLWFQVEDYFLVIKNSFFST